MSHGAKRMPGKSPSCRRPSRSNHTASPCATAARGQSRWIARSCTGWPPRRGGTSSTVTWAPQSERAWRALIVNPLTKNGVPEDHSSLKNAPRIRLQLALCDDWHGNTGCLVAQDLALFLTKIRTLIHEEISLLTVLYFPICRVPEYSELSVAIEPHPCVSSGRARNIKARQERPRVHHRPYIGGPRKSLVQSVPVPVPSSQDLPRRRCVSSRCFRGQAKERSRPCRFRLAVNASRRCVDYVLGGIVGTIYPSGLCRVTESLCRFGPEIPDRVAKSLSESPDIVSCLLQAVQEGEESIAGFVTPRCSIGRVFLGKCFLLHGKCRFEINLCGFNMFVPEPQCDHRTIDACLQKIHGHGVPQAVHGDTFVFQRRAQVRSRHPMLVQ